MARLQATKWPPTSEADHNLRYLALGGLLCCVLSAVCVSIYSIMLEFARTQHNYGERERAQQKSRESHVLGGSVDVMVRRHSAKRNK